MTRLQDLHLEQLVSSCSMRRFAGSTISRQARRPFMTMSSPQILSRIGELVDEERTLRERHGETPLDEKEHAGFSEFSKAA